MRQDVPIRSRYDGVSAIVSSRGVSWGTRCTCAKTSAKVRSTILYARLIACQTVGILDNIFDVSLVDTINEICDHEARSVLLEFCDQLPEEDCYRGEQKPPRPEPKKCDEEEFPCGDGKCIRGLDACDNEYHCYNGADELGW